MWIKYLQYRFCISAVGCRKSALLKRGHIGSFIWGCNSKKQMFRVSRGNQRTHRVVSSLAWLFSVDKCGSWIDSNWKEREQQQWRIWQRASRTSWFQKMVLQLLNTLWCWLWSSSFVWLLFRLSEQTPMRSLKKYVMHWPNRGQCRTAKLKANRSVESSAERFLAYAILWNSADRCIWWGLFFEF